MVKVKKVLPSDGDRWNQESILAIQKDYFFASPILAVIILHCKIIKIKSRCF